MAADLAGLQRVLRELRARGEAVIGRTRETAAPPATAGAGASSVASVGPEQLRDLEIRIHGVVESLFSGEYQSLFRGAGLEFSHLREYEPGDDVRAIDWRVTARRNSPYIRQYVEERDLTLVLVVDVSASKTFGTGLRSTAEVALEIAALLALAAARNNDRVALLLVSDRVERFIVPRSGRRQALRVLLELAEFRAEHPGTRLTEGVRFTRRVFPQRSIVVMISDFIVDADEFEALSGEMMALATRHDVIPVVLADPVADVIPDVGMTMLRDPETGRLVPVDTGSPEFRRAYVARVEADRRKLRTLFRELRLQPLELDAADGGLDPLLRYFRRRNAANR